MGRTCSIARYWGRGSRAWRCNLPAKHEGKHFDNRRQMYWGDVLIAITHTEPQP